MKVFKRLVLITAIILVTCTGISFAAQTGEVNTSGIRIRKEANTTSDILTVIYKGDKVEILDESGEWFKIKASGNTGYVKKEFIKLNNEVSNKPENTSKPNNTTVKKDNTVKQENTVDSTNTVVENKVETLIHDIQIIKPVYDGKLHLQLTAYINQEMTDIVATVDSLTNQKYFAAFLNTSDE